MLDSQHGNTLRAVLLGLLLLLAALADADSPADSALNYERQLQKLKSNIKSLQQQLASDRGQRAKLQQELQRTETEIGTLQSDIQALNSKLARQQQELDGLQQQRRQLQQAREAQQAEISQQIDSAYRMGRESQWKLLLNQEDPGLWARYSRYHRYLLTARAEKIQQYLATVAEIDALTPRIRQQTDQLQANRAQLQKRQESLASNQSQRKQALASLNRDISGGDEQLQALGKDQQRLEQLIEEVTQALANLSMPGAGEGFESRRGKMPMPAQGKLDKRFGQARVAGKLNWQGILITAAAGSAVRAIHPGRVVFADYLRGHGLLLIIDHGQGYMSLYAHNQSLLKETGQWVSSDEIIARVGNSGGQSENALYFEIRHHGKPVNPSQWCKSA